MQLAQLGIHVVLACRSPERAGAALNALQGAVPGGSFEVAKVDLGNIESVVAFADDYKQRFSRLDMLCNNAGVIGVPLAYSPLGFELHMATNYFGPFVLVGQLLGLLRATPDSRIVNVSSQIHRLAKLPIEDLNWKHRPYGPWAAYGQSKLAVAVYTTELERRLRKEGNGVTAVIAQPGFAATDTQVNGAVARFLGQLVLRSGLVHSAAEGARSTVYALTSPDVRGGDYVGPDNWLGSSGPPERSLPSVAARSADLGAELWKQSCAVTGMSYL
jgi:NAD(P)-dependent dehydrogenase (short-subunit alcohol dehydrogenase family)